MMQGGSSTGGGLNATPGGAGGGQTVQEVGGGQLAVLPGSGSSLEAVAGSRQALAMYAGEEGEAGRLPKDWQRLHKDRDLRVRGVAGDSRRHMQQQTAASTMQRV
jgi:hypothetical protein